MNREYTRAPHRRGPENGSPNAALLIDFDNVTMGIRSNLGQELRNLLDSDMIRGKVAVQRAYADWRRYPQYIVPLSEASIDLIFAPAYGSSKKNATDIRLAIDACELVFTRPEIGTFILLSGDSDFSSLVLKLKEYGKYVIGVGLQESSSDILVQNCDEYYSYTALSGLRVADETTSQKLDPWQLVEKALQRMVDRSDVMRSDRLKQVMLELDSSFDEKSAGYSKFNRFLAEAAHKGIVSLRKAGDGQYELRPTGTAGASEDKPQPSEQAAASGRSGRRGGGRRERREEPRGRSEEPRGRREESGRAPAEAGREADSGAGGLRRAYELLRSAVEGLTPDEEGRVRDSEVKRKILAEEQGFDETTLGFRKFSRFLQQAHDEGVVDLMQGEDGNYYLSPSGDGARAATAGEAGADGGAPPEEPAATGERQTSGTGTGRRGGRGRGRGRGRRDASGERPEKPSGPAREETPSPAATAGRESAAGGEEEAEVDPADVAAASAAAAADERRRSRRAAAGDGPAEESGDGPAGGAAPTGDAGARRRGLGRFRRGSRGRSPSEPAKPSAGLSDIGPVEEPEAEEAAPAASRMEEDETGAADREDSGGPGAEAGGPSAGGAGRTSDSGPRRGLGRFRRGSRGASGSGPASAGPGPGSPAEAGTRTAGTAEQARGGAAPSAEGDGAAAPASGSRDAARDQAMEHMIRNYAGVGRKTAQRLVEEFGGEVFRVMDDQPGRITDLLSDHRAQAVLDAREAERRSE